MHILYVWSYWQYPQVAMEFLQKVRERDHKISVLLGKSGRVLDTDFVDSNFFDSNFVDSNIVDSNIDFHFASTCDILSNITRTPYPILKNVSRYIKMLNPDILHVNSHLFLSSCQAVEVARSMGIPSVVTVHGVMAKRGWILDVLQAIYLRTMARSLFGKVSAIICLTKSDWKSVARIVGSESRIDIVPNGVDTESFKPTDIKDSNLIAWVGRLVPEKGLIYLLKAMKKVAKEHCDVKLVLAGNGPSKTKLMNLVSNLRLNDRIRFAGAVGRDEVVQLLSRSSIFVLPSLREGMPMALLEAMASGNSIIASNILGINEIVRNNQNGVLFAPRNVDELASTLSWLLSDRMERNRLANNARKTIEKRFSWNTMLDKLESIYDTLA